MTLIDTHAHLTMADYDGGIDGILQRARLAGVSRCILAGTTGEDSRQNTELTAQHPAELACTVGIHPHEAAGCTDDALDDCLANLDNATSAGPLSVVFHCFSSGPDDAGRILDHGFHLSFTGVVTFNNARDLQQVAVTVPNDRYMLETDCPYLAPVPKRGHWPNEPALLPLVAQKIAQLRGQSADEIAETTSENARRFFRLARS